MDTQRWANEPKVHSGVQPIDKVHKTEWANEPYTRLAQPIDKVHKAEWANEPKRALARYKV